MNGLPFWAHASTSGLMRCQTASSYFFASASRFLVSSDGAGQLSRAKVEAHIDSAKKLKRRKCANSLSPVLRGEGRGEGLATSVRELRNLHASASHPSPLPSPLSTGE